MTEAKTPVLDVRKLSRTPGGGTLRLTLCTYVGLGIASLFGVGLPALIVGLVTVPLWGSWRARKGVRNSLRGAVKLHQVQVLPDDAPLTRTVHRLCDRLGLEARPKVGTMPAFNAYAIGSSHRDSMVVIGQPLLDRLAPIEILAIIGHELGHIANYDMRRMTYARSFQRAFTWFLVLESVRSKASAVLDCLSELMVLKLSRNREYWADAIGAALTSREAMISAVHAIHQVPPPLSKAEHVNARMMFRGITRKLAIWSTHPTLEQRVGALETGSHFNRLPHLGAARALASASAPLPKPQEAI